MTDDPITYEISDADPGVEISPDAGANHRVPCVLALDTSGSMRGRPIQQLTDALHVFRSDLMSHDEASEMVELAVITFSSTVTVAQDFTGVHAFEPTRLQAGGRTCMGEAILQAADLIEDRKQYYKTQGLTYNRPWLWLMTDGKPNGGQVEAATSTIRAAEQGKRFLFFGAGTDSADMDALRSIAYDPQRVIEMKGNCFEDLFRFVSGSLKRSSDSVTSGTPNEQLALPAPSSTWARVSV
jgi:uncharacterized protein YegL